MSTVAVLKQRSEYTHKHNIDAGRHGWLRLTPAYSVKVVDELLREEDPAATVFDPFCGTGTTALTASYLGHNAITTDNRMSYIRELRPYMYWLGYLTDAKQASSLDWEAIGGTWGSATSKLTTWTSGISTYQSSVLPSILKSIASPGNANGQLLANYVEKYFCDTHLHLTNLREVLNNRAKITYIVGNSTFYGTILPVETLYKEIMETVGFREVIIKPLRKRNSKKELIEFSISATWKC